jgi:hypothetical protein
MNAGQEAAARARAAGLSAARAEPKVQQAIIASELLESMVPDTLQTVDSPAGKASLRDRLARIVGLCARPADRPGQHRDAPRHDSRHATGRGRAHVLIANKAQPLLAVVTELIDSNSKYNLSGHPRKVASHPAP